MHGFLSANMIWLSPFHKIKKLPRRLTDWLTAGTDLVSQYNHYGTILRKCAAYHRGEAPVLATYLFLAKIADTTPSLKIMLFDLQPHLFRSDYPGTGDRILSEKCRYWPFSGG
jgi:hypothetical protein